MKVLILGLLTIATSPAYSLEHGTTDANEFAATAITYYQEVAPILNKQCQGCHQEGALAAYLPLGTYAQVKPLAKRIRSITQTRKMPPFMPDNSGSCASYEDARVLDDQELATLAAWAEQGAPEGVPVSLPAPKQPGTLEGQTHQTAMEEAYTPDKNKHDDYRCFVMSPGFSGSKPLYLTDFLITPGDSTLVHHVVAYQVSSAKAGAEARKLEQADSIPGYSCFGGAGVSGSRMVMNWSPGTGTISLPRDTGIRLDPDLPLVFQVHYHISQTNPGSDLTQIKMKLADTVPHEITPTFLSPLKSLQIPPQQKNFVHEGSVALNSRLGFNKALTIVGVRAHMHKLGAQMHVAVKTKQQDRCIIDVPRYDYNWQTSYFLQQPIEISSNDPINIRCVYDSSSKTTSTSWGEGTEDEMCIATIYTLER